jgi:hypothetical protein
MLRVYKPLPDAYRRAAALLAVEPREILMVACHNFDLDAARGVGYLTAFVRRPDEWGPAGPPIRYPAPRPILWSAGLGNSPTTSAPENLRDVGGPVHFEGPKVCWLSAGGRRIRTFGPPLE